MAHCDRAPQTSKLFFQVSAHNYFYQIIFIFDLLVWKGLAIPPPMYMNDVISLKIFVQLSQQTTHIHTYTYTHMHACTHTNTHARTHTQTHTLSHDGHTYMYNSAADYQTSDTPFPLTVV